jgi:hypothetical protein
MNAQRPSARTSLSRRGALGLLGAFPLAVGGAAAALAQSAQAGTGHDGTLAGPPRRCCCRVGLPGRGDRRGRLRPELLGLRPQHIFGPAGMTSTGFYSG